MKIQLAKRCKCGEKPNCNGISSLKQNERIPSGVHNQIRALTRSVSKGGKVPANKPVFLCPNCVPVTLGLWNCCTLTWPTSGCSFPPDLGTNFVHTVSVQCAGGREKGECHIQFREWTLKTACKEERKQLTWQARIFFY